MEFFSVKLVYRSFPIFDVILISYRECWTGMSIHFPSVWIFYFYFFPSLQTTSFVFPISNNIHENNNTRSKEIVTIVETRHMTSKSPPTRDASKKGSSPGLRGLLLPRDANLQGLLEACIPLLPLSCSRAPEQAQPGEPVSSALPVFSTPPFPDRVIHDHTPNPTFPRW